MTANPWDKFFWNDWENDPALKLCSLSAQGLWMRILCICAKADPKGYMLVAGHSLPPSDLASLVGKPVPEIETLLDELARYGVFSTDRTGRIYNRRMVRQVKKARTNRENGKNGGNPTLLKQRSISAWDNPPDKPPLKPHKPEAISHEQQLAREREADSSELQRLQRILGLDETDFRKVSRDLDTLIRLKADGCDFDRHIRPAAEHAAKSGRARSLSYIEARAVELRDAEKRVASMPIPVEHTNLDGWQNRMRVLVEKGLWHPKNGPKPGELGCVVPREVLAEFGFGGEAQPAEAMRPCG